MAIGFRYQGARRPEAYHTGDPTVSHLERGGKSFKRRPADAIHRRRALICKKTTPTAGSRIVGLSGPWWRVKMLNNSHFNVRSQGGKIDRGTARQWMRYIVFTEWSKPAKRVSSCRGPGQTMKMSENRGWFGGSGGGNRSSRLKI